MYGFYGCGLRALERRVQGSGFSAERALTWGLSSVPV